MALILLAIPPFLVHAHDRTVSPAESHIFAHLRGSLEESGISTVIIALRGDVRVRRVVDREIYRQRNLVERFFNKLKHFRRIATRFDKLARNYLAVVTIAAARLWARAYESTT